ncbi:MAG TPA: TetR/AcrR family transcriptional regulator [Gemmatimonadales bacterium]|nr:TetR/AcrR family transcriptional regulator [Gemmatimonadales bacterium]
MTELEVSRRERKKEETKERIVKAALRLFKDHGFDATTVDQIAEQADVAKGTFFNYFPRKEAVFGYLSETWVADAEQKIAAILAKGLPSWPKVRDVFLEFASIYEEDRELSLHMAMEWTRRMHAPDDDVCRRWDALGVHVVRQLQAQGELRRDVAAERASQVLADVYHGTLMMWLESPEPPFPLKDEIRKRLALVIEGLTPRAKEGR